MLPKVAVITLNWNGKHHTDECLQSLLKLDYPQYEIFVVDNGSVDGSMLHLKPKYPNVHFIENPRNLGFAEGNNIGIKTAHGKGFDYFFLINNDTTVDSHTLTALVESVNKHNASIAGPKIYNYYHKNIIESAGGHLTVWKSKNYQIGYKEEDTGQHDNEQQVTFVTGCAMLVTSGALDNGTLFDPSYFAYCEDNDLCYRLIKNGKKILYVPSAKIWHKVSASTGGYKNPNAVYLFTRNRILFIQKNGTLQQKIGFWLYFLTYYLPAYSLYSLITLQYAGLASFYRGILSHYFRKFERNDFLQPYLPQNPGMTERVRQQMQLYLNKAYIPLSYLSIKFFPYNHRKQPKNVLVVELTHIGDLIMTTPLLQALRKHYPKARIDMLCAGWNNTLFPTTELVDHVINYNSPLFSPKDTCTNILNRLRLFYALQRKKYDLIVDLRGDYYTFMFFLLFFRKRRVEWWGTHIMERKLAATKPKHMVDSKTALLKSLRITPRTKRLMFTLEQSALQWAHRFLCDTGQPVVTIAPGARWNFRAWPKEKFAQLADKLTERGARVVLIGSPDEKKLAEDIASMMKSTPLIAAGQASIQQSAALISKSALFVGNDSGPMHIAAALNIPTVALFGPQTPELTGPYHHKKIVLRKHVWCSPCPQTTCINQSDWCMNKISLEEVYEAALKLWPN